MYIGVFVEHKKKTKNDFDIFKWLRYCCAIYASYAIGKKNEEIFVLLVTMHTRSKH